MQYLYTVASERPVQPDPAHIVANMAACCALGIYPTELVEQYRGILLKNNLTLQCILPFTSFLLSTPHPLEPLTVHPGPYPPFTTGLLATVANYIINQVPLDLQSASPALPPTAVSEDYKALLLPLPFELLKYILESPTLHVRSEKQRYELAKCIVSKRASREKQTRKRNETAPLVEESVILRVGGGQGEGVQVLRSYTRRRVWKTGHHGRKNDGIVARE
jgi:hypothetical protein